MPTPLPKPKSSLLLGMYPEGKPAVAGVAAATDAWIHNLHYRYQTLRGHNLQLATASDMQLELRQLCAQVALYWQQCSQETLSEAELIAASALLRNRTLLEAGREYSPQRITSIAALLSALRGIPVHLVCADAEDLPADLERAAHALGLTCASIAEGAEVPQRKSAYQADIVCVSARQLMYDYLQDQQNNKSLQGVIRGRLCRLANKTDTILLRGLCCALISDARTVLVEQASRPLALAVAADGQSSHAESVFAEAMLCARALEQGLHYSLDNTSLVPAFTEAGCETVQMFTTGFGPLWRGVQRRQTLVAAALAVAAMTSGKHFRMEQDRVVELNVPWHESDFTGLAANDFKQLILIRENSGNNASAPLISKRLSVQHFFQLYVHLSAAGHLLGPQIPELIDVYGFHAACISAATPRHAILQGPFRQPAQRSAAITQLLEAGSGGNLLCISNNEQSRVDFESSLQPGHAKMLQRIGNGPLPACVGGMCLSLTMTELQAAMDNKFDLAVFDTLFFTSTPATLFAELWVCSQLETRQSCIIFACVEDHVFAQTPSWLRLLMPRSKTLYTLARKHLELPGRTHRRLVAAQDHYIRNSLSLGRDN